jgi:ABC-2 type transport system ATP-binding protein
MTAVLETRSLTKRYGHLVAVDDLSLEIREGEVFGLLGPNGAGKTTTIGMLCGLLKPSGGQVFIREEGSSTGMPAAASASAFARRTSFSGGN